MLNLWMNWEKLFLNLRFIVENKIRSLHKIRAVHISHFTWYIYHVCMIQILQYFNLRMYQKLWKICFLLGKMEVWIHSKFCIYFRIFGLRKNPEYLYRLFDVLRMHNVKLNHYNSKSLHSAIFNVEQGAKFISSLILLA